MTPCFKRIVELELQEVDSLGAVVRTSDSIMWEDVEAAVAGEMKVFEIGSDGVLDEVTAGVTYVPPRRFYASLSNVIYHPFCNIVTKDHEIVFEDTIAETARDFGAWPLNYLQLARVSSPDARESLPKCREPMILGGHSSCAIFGHFLLDMLPLIVRYREMLNSGEVKIAFFQMNDWMRDLLSLVDVTPDCVKILELQPVFFSHAIISHHHSAKTTQYPCANAEVSYKVLRDRVEDHLLFEKVFFLRGGAMQRLKNEPQVAALFASRGFVVLDPQQFSVRKQAEIVKHAKVFASVYGSGFGLSPLMEPSKGIAIELAPSTIVDHWLRRLLARLGLRHFAIVYNGETQTIDVASLSKMLDAILA